MNQPRERALTPAEASRTLQRRATILGTITTTAVRAYELLQRTQPKAAGINDSKAKLETTGPTPQLMRCYACEVLQQDDGFFEYRGQAACSVRCLETLARN